MLGYWKILVKWVNTPDFDTPENIQQAGINAIKSGQTRSTAVDGTPTLANVIKQTKRASLIMAPNKTLAAQLYSEGRPSHKLPTHWQ
jgi:excinuclease UvrABC helicase subunit UvrB